MAITSVNKRRHRAVWRCQREVACLRDRRAVGLIRIEQHCPGDHHSDRTERSSSCLRVFLRICRDFVVVALSSYRICGNFRIGCSDRSKFGTLFGHGVVLRARLGWNSVGAQPDRARSVAHGHVLAPLGLLQAGFRAGAGRRCCGRGGRRCGRRCAATGGNPPQAASAEAATIAEADTTRTRKLRLVFILQTLSRNLRDP